MGITSEPKWLLNETSSIIAAEVKERIPPFERNLETIIQDSANKGVYFQGYTLVRLRDAFCDYFAAEFATSWKRLEQTLLADPKYIHSLESIIFTKFVSVLPTIDEAFKEFDQIPVMTGRSELGPTIAKLKAEVTEKYNLLVSIAKEDSRRLAIQIRESEKSTFDRWIRWSKNRWWLFVPYQILLSFAALNALLTIINYIAGKVSAP